jgi:hypothetical protein
VRKSEVRKSESGVRKSESEGGIKEQDKETRRVGRGEEVRNT